MRTLLLLLAVGCSSGGDKRNADSATTATTPTGTPTPTTPTGTTTPSGTPTPTVPGLVQFDGPVPTNILWVSIDTLRRDEFSRYGGADHMPFLDELMAEGFVLDDVRQCSNWTGAGTSCTMSGRYGIDAGFVPILGDGNGEIPDADSVFYAEILRDAGYTTEIITTNGWLESTWGNTQGYDQERRFGGAKAGTVFDEGLADLLAVPADDPWFFHLHLFDPHAPYDAPEEYLDALEGRAELPWDLSNRTEHYAVNSGPGYDDLSPGMKAELAVQLRIRYQAELTYMDELIDDIWVVYDAAGLLDDTLVVFWADHGEAFFENGRQTHAWDLYSPENSVMMFLWSKNIVPGSYDGPVSTIDLVPSLLAMQGREIPPQITGIPFHEITDDRARFAMAVARAGVVQSVMRGTHRLQFYWSDGTVVLTDAATDPDETINLYDPADPLTLELWDLLLPRIAQAQAAANMGRYEVTWPEGLPR